MTSARVSGPRKRGSDSRVAQAREKQVYAAVREALVSIRRFDIGSVVCHAWITSVLWVERKLGKYLVVPVVVKAQAQTAGVFDTAGKTGRRIRLQVHENTVPF